MLLYRRIAPGDDAAVWRRRKELDTLFGSLTPDQARELSDRLQPGNGVDQPPGDLARHFQRRLASPTRRTLRHVLADRTSRTPEEPTTVGGPDSQERGENEDPQQSTRRPSGATDADRLAGPAYRGTDPDVSVRRAEPQPARASARSASDPSDAELGMSKDLERAFKTPKRRIPLPSIRYFDLYVFLKGKAVIKSKAGGKGPRAKIVVDEQPADPSGEGGRLVATSASVETAIGEFLGEALNARLRVELKNIGARNEGLDVSLRFGHERMRVIVRSNPLSPVSITSKVMKEEVEWTIEGVGTVRAEMSIEVHVELAPNYVELASSQVVRGLARRAGDLARRAAAKVSATGGMTVRWGRDAILSAVRFGGKIVGYVPTLVSATGRGASAVGRWFVVGLRAIGVGTWIGDGIWFTVAVLLWAHRMRLEGEAAGHFSHFQRGYAEQLAYLTDAAWLVYFEEVRIVGNPKEWKVRPPKEEGALRAWVRTEPARQSVGVSHDLSEVHWARMYQNSLRVVHSLSSRTKDFPSDFLDIQDIAQHEARFAGRACAYQDVLRFIVAASDVYEEDGTIVIRNGQDVWDQVAGYHRAIYGGVRAAREQSYRSRVLSLTRVAIEPFHEP